MTEQFQPSYWDAFGHRMTLFLEFTLPLDHLNVISMTQVKCHTDGLASSSYGSILGYKTPTVSQCFSSDQKTNQSNTFHKHNIVQKQRTLKSLK